MVEKFDLGSIKYRYPLCLETQELVMGMQGMELLKDQIAHIIDNLDLFIEKVDVKWRGKKLNSCEDLKSCPNVFVASAVYRVATDIFKAIFVDEEEKKQ